MLTTKTIEEVKERIVIEDIVKEYIAIKKSGRNYVCCCPFHNERTPSFFIFPDKNCFRCFGCGESGDGISFIRKIENLNFIETIEFLAKKYGIKIEEKNDTGYLDTTHQKKEEAQIILDYAKTYFQNNLNNNPTAKEYLNKRKITEATIKDFAFGYSVNSFSDWYDYSQKLNLNTNIQTEIGLISYNSTKNIFIDKFRDRLMLPIQDQNGNTVGFAGRILKDTEKEAKYINSQESFLFHKSKLLFGLYQAKNTIRELKKCYLVEGYFDVISLSQCGIKNVIASCGTSLTDDQCRLLKRYTDCVTIFYDSDAAGKKATERAIEKLLQNNFMINVISIDDIKDPDEVAKNIKENVKEYIQSHEIDFIEFLVKNNPINGDINEKNILLHKIYNFIQFVNDDIYRGILISRTKILLGVDISFNPIKQIKQVIQKQEEKIDPIEAYEYELLRFFILYGDENIDEKNTIAEYLLTKFSEFDFINDKSKQIKNICISLASQKKLSVKNILNNIDDEELKSKVVDITTAQKEISNKWLEKMRTHVFSEKDNLQKAIEKNILRYQLRIIHKIILEQINILKNEFDEKRIEKISSEINILKQKEVEIAKQLKIVIL